MNLKLWLKSLKRGSQIAVVIALLLSISVLAYATSVLWATAHSNTTLSKQHFLTVSISGATATGSIKPGGSVALAPAVANSGDVDAGVFIKVTMPTIPDSTEAAYTFEPADGWNLVSSSGGVQVWSWGSDSAMESVSPGGSTDPLTTSFTMLPTITGAQFAAMSDVDIGLDGYLIDYAEIVESDPLSAWRLIG